MSNSRPEAGVKLRDDEKVKHIPVTIIPTEKEDMLRKPEWIKIRLPRTLNSQHSLSAYQSRSSSEQ